MSEPLPELGAPEEPDAKLERLRAQKHYQDAPQQISDAGFELSQDETTLLNQWANVSVQMTDTARMFEVKKRAEAFMTYPGSNGCSTCCNYQGCAVEAVQEPGGGDTT